MTKEKLTSAQYQAQYGKSKSKFKGEDQHQYESIEWFKKTYPQYESVLYGNATANIFNSSGISGKKLTRNEQLAAANVLGKPIYNWGMLMAAVLGKVGLRISFKKIDDDIKGGQFYLLNKTKALGAKKSWPDIQVASGKEVGVHIGGKQYDIKRFNGLFIELKDPAASTLPYGKSGHGAFSDGEHIQSQGVQLSELCKHGNMALFCVGVEEFKRVVSLYLDYDSNKDNQYFDPQVFKDKSGIKRTIYRIRYDSSYPF